MFRRGDHFATTPTGPNRQFAAPGVQNTAAGRESRVATVDALAFTGLGPRAAHAIHAVASKIYPEMRFAALPGRQWAEAETPGL